MNEKVSVIVPVYNVKDYLPKCLESLSKQDYENLQIILVDDGATDGCGKMCDLFAEKHSNVEVIHQRNQGLSAARNSGTQKAKGEYIAYIDSDDWVTDDYISHQMRLVKQYDADIVVMRQQSVWDGLDPEPVNYSEEKVTCYNRVEAIETMIYGYKIQTSACKLFRRDIISKHPFPVGELYEDSAIMYQVFSDANRIVASNLPLYCYRRRSGSIINEKFDSRHLVILEHSNQLYEFIKNNYPQLLQAAGYRCAYSVTELAPKVIAANDMKLFMYIQDELCKHYDDLIHNKKAKTKIKIRGFAVKHGVLMTKMEIKAEQTIKKMMGKKLY
jgi:glycosyltransferase involved in cell wall biosynthesis